MPLLPWPMGSLPLPQPRHQLIRPPPTKQLFRDFLPSVPPASPIRLPSPLSLLPSVRCSAASPPVIAVDQRAVRPIIPPPIGPPRSLLALAGTLGGSCPRSCRDRFGNLCGPRLPK